MTCLAALCLLPGPAAAAHPDFVEGLYPRLEAHNCRACHNASGVASHTRLHFPESGSSREVIQRFGLGLARLIDRRAPGTSILLAKPTNRIPHTGGPLVALGSTDEDLLVQWIERLASLPAPVETAAVAGRQRAPEPLRRLTHVQYDNSIRDLLGDRTRPSRNFPPEDFVNGYTNQASAQAVTPALAEAYGRAAERLERNAFRYGDEGGLIPCLPSGAVDRDCAEAFVGDFGAKAYRRPLDPSETAALADLFLEWSSRYVDFLAGASAVVEVLLQSPDFLFLVPHSPSSALKPFDVASRLSYALWNAPPDNELFMSAAAGRLDRPAEIERQARRMLAASPARDAFDEFVAQWLRFDRVRDSVKDRNRYRDFSREVAESMTEESRLLFRHVAWNDIDFREFFLADFTFVDDFLTAIYRMPDPRQAFARTPYPAGSSRAGVLSHGTFLAQTGKPTGTSPTERGLFVRDHFLCQAIPPPPPGVDASLPPISLGAKPRTVRETMTKLHAADKACASCHKLVDPIGFGFEHFDTIGAYRETELVRVEPTPQQERLGMKAETHELAIDPAGFIAGVEDSAFATPREAGRILANSRICQKCIVKQVFRYLFGRHEASDDLRLIDAAYNRFESAGFRFRELILGLVVTEEFLGTEWSD